MAAEEDMAVVVALAVLVDVFMVDADVAEAIKIFTHLISLHLKIKI